MTLKVAVVIVNYNMPERTDALVDYIWDEIDPSAYDLIVVDNGSDLVYPSYNTTIFLKRNRQTTLGWLAGLDYADFLEKHDIGGPFFAYWILITSGEISRGQGDILTPMVDFMSRDPKVAIMHPALTEDSTTAWKHLKDRRGGCVWRTWMVDNIAALYRATWFNKIGRFDPKLTFAWGIDLESCYLARKDGMSIWVDGRHEVKKITNIGYKMNRMNMSSNEREKLAREQMTVILRERYGPDWNTLMREWGIDNDQR